MSTKFSIESKFVGYRNKEDITNLPSGLLVVGSQNVLTNGGERIQCRPGYTLYGQANAALTPIKSAFDWLNIRGAERHMRSYQDELEFLYVDPLGVPTWRRLANGFGDHVNFNYTTFWDKNEQIREALFVNGTNNVYEWSGGITTFASASNSAGVISGFSLTPTGEIQSINPVPPAGGSGYTAGNIVTITTGDGNGTVTVNTVDGGGAVLTMTLDSPGTGYSTGIGQATTGGAGTGLLVTITAVYPSGAGTGYAIGDTITITGGGGNAVLEVLTVDVFTGAIQTLRVVNPGTGYSVSDGNATTTSGAGTGALINITSVATGYLEKQGTTTWAEEGFYTTGGRFVTLNGVSHTYTGGENTTFLTGVSPSAVGATVGDVIFQDIRTNPMVSFVGGPAATFLVSLIASLNNQIYYASLTDQVIYLSQQNAFNDLAFSTPREPGEGWVFAPLDAAPVAFQVQEEFMYVSAGKDFWYKISFELSSDLLSESALTEKLKTTIFQGAQSQSLTTKDKNSINFLSFEPTVTTLGRVQLFQTPQNVDISDPIKNDMDGYDFNGGSIIYFKNYVYLTIPQNAVYRIFNIQKQWWEAPQTGSFSRFSIINDELYAHSSTVPETYKLFTGATDNGAPINAIAAFSYQDFGNRPNTKSFNEYYVEGYISSNTDLTLTLLYDYRGSRGTKNYVIRGSQAAYNQYQQIIFIPADDGSLGKHSLGKASLAGREQSDDAILPPKFRIIKTFPKLDFYEMQVQFSTNQFDAHWELIAWGPDAQLSTSGNNNISI